LLLVEGEPRKALLWAHLFAHYRRIDYPPGESFAERRQAYAASLLLRSATALERVAGDYGSIQVDLDEFVARHDADIRAGMVARRESVADKAEARPENRLVQASSTVRRSDIGTGEPGQAIYRIGVGRDGRVKRVLIVDSVPDRRFGWRMRNIARRTRFNPSPDAEPLRWAVMPIVFDDHSVSMRPKATTKRTDTPRP
jgi:TonB family protein